MNAYELLQSKWSGGDWIEMVEVIPPRSADARQLLHDAGTPGETLLLVADNPGGAPCMSAEAAAAHLANEGFPVVMTMNCRDMNRIALQSRLLGAYSLGVRAFFVTPGAHQTLGAMPDARNVHDLDPVQLLATLKNIRDNGTFSNGETAPGEWRFFTGIPAHPFTGAPELKPFIFRKKRAMGADFFITPPVSDFQALAAWRDAVADGDADSPRVIIGLQRETALPETFKKDAFFCGVCRYAG